MFGWAAVFFVLLNVAVWALYDVRFLDRFGKDRLLMNPSENELESVIHHIQRDSEKRHIIFLGDSITWGVGIDDPAQTFVGHIQTAFADQGDTRVLNLSVPGATFFDQFAILRKLYRPEDTYVVVLDPIAFYKQRKLTHWEDLARFPRFDAEVLADDLDAIRACCAMETPRTSPVEASIRHAAFRLLPLYRNRDIISKSAIGLTASNAATAIIDRAFVSGFERVPEKEVIPALSGLRQVPFAIDEHPLVKILSLLSARHRAPNILYVIADEATYRRDAAGQRNIDAVLRALDSASILNLYTAMDRTHITGDGIHLTMSGHAALAEQLLQSLPHALP